MTVGRVALGIVFSGTSRKKESPSRQPPEERTKRLGKQTHHVTSRGLRATAPRGPEGGLEESIMVAKVSSSTIATIGGPDTVSSLNREANDGPLTHQNLLMSPDTISQSSREIPCAFPDRPLYREMDQRAGMEFFTQQRCPGWRHVGEFEVNPDRAGYQLVEVRGRESTFELIPIYGRNRDGGVENIPPGAPKWLDYLSGEEIEPWKDPVRLGYNCAIIRPKSSERTPENTGEQNAIVWDALRKQNHVPSSRHGFFEIEKEKKGQNWKVTSYRYDKKHKPVVIATSRNVKMGDAEQAAEYLRADELYGPLFIPLEEWKTLSLQDQKRKLPILHQVQLGPLEQGFHYTSSFGVHMPKEVQEYWVEVFKVYSDLADYANKTVSVGPNEIFSPMTSLPSVYSHAGASRAPIGNDDETSTPIPYHEVNSSVTPHTPRTPIPAAYQWPSYTNHANTSSDVYPQSIDTPSLSGTQPLAGVDESGVDEFGKKLSAALQSVESGHEQAQTDFYYDSSRITVETTESSNPLAAIPRSHHSNPLITGQTRSFEKLRGYEMNGMNGKHPHSPTASSSHLEGSLAFRPSPGQRDLRLFHPQPSGLHQEFIPEDSPPYDASRQENKSFAPPRSPVTSSYQPQSRPFYDSSIPVEQADFDEHPTEEPAASSRPLDIVNTAPLSKMPAAPHRRHRKRRG